MKPVTYGGFSMRPCEHPVNIPTIGDLMKAYLDGVATIMLALGEWARKDGAPSAS